ncbi:hypothetical protein ACFQL0_17270 [Haloplanus litoreus]|uniref:hypothetical protein n=1 Tax=Haloplanus litoreus TaxID=767515 RepID=UPI00361353D7
MSDARPLAPRHVVAVALAIPLGTGVFLLPSGVENLGGPATPVTYLAGTLAVCSLAVAYAVFLSARSPTATASPTPPSRGRWAPVRSDSWPRGRRSALTSPSSRPS